MKKTLRLQNWQAHKDSTIELAPVLTTIRGKSHHGKSSIIRAFQWMRDNRPQKTRFIHKGTKKATVTLDNITHERTASSNKYFIKGKEDPFTALRGAVPDEITSELGIGPDSIQGQHDPIFLLNDSPGKVAQKLSTLVDLEATTKALKFISAKKRKHKSTINTYKEIIKSKQIELNKLQHVDPADIELLNLESEQTHIAKLTEKRTEVYNAIENVLYAESELSKIPSIDALEPAKQLVKHYGELRQYKKLRNSVKKETQTIEKYKKIVALNPKKLLRKAKRLINLNDKVNDISDAVVSIIALESKINKYKKEETKLLAKKDKALEGTCPLCGRSD